MFVVELMQAW